jgi:hypothetical protein
MLQLYRRCKAQASSIMWARPRDKARGQPTRASRAALSSVLWVRIGPMGPIGPVSRCRDAEAIGKLGLPMPHEKANCLVDRIREEVEQITGKSGRQDLNLRPLRPERSALAKLSYSPVVETCSIARIAKDCKL